MTKNRKQNGSATLVRRSYGFAKRDPIKDYMEEQFVRSGKTMSEVCEGNIARSTPRRWFKDGSTGTTRFDTTATFLLAIGKPVIDLRDLLKIARKR